MEINPIPNLEGSVIMAVLKSKGEARELARTSGSRWEDPEEASEIST
jgi:hypothetical protein